MTKENLNKAKEELFNKVYETMDYANYDDYWHNVVKAVGKRGIDTMKDIIMVSDIPFYNKTRFKYLSLDEDTDVIYNFMRLMIVEYVLTDNYIRIPSILEML